MVLWNYAMQIGNAVIYLLGKSWLMVTVINSFDWGEFIFALHNFLFYCHFKTTSL